MKFYEILIACLLTTLSHQGQIGTIQKSTPSVTVGKVAPVGTFIAELSLDINPVDDKDTTYTLKYRDYQFKQTVSIESIKFSGIGDTEDQLYNVFKSVFLEENRNNKEYLLKFTLGEKPVAIGNYKSMGTTMAIFMNGRSYFYLTDKQVDKLFGK